MFVDLALLRHLQIIQIHRCQAAGAATGTGLFNLARTLQRSFALQPRSLPGTGLRSLEMGWEVETVLLLAGCLRSGLRPPGPLDRTHRSQSRASEDSIEAGRSEAARRQVNRAQPQLISQLKPPTVCFRVAIGISWCGGAMLGELSPKRQASPPGLLQVGQTSRTCRGYTTAHNAWLQWCRHRPTPN